MSLRGKIADALRSGADKAFEADGLPDIEPHQGELPPDEGDAEAGA